MINENLIVRILQESNLQKQRYKVLYEHCTNKGDRQMYRNAYLKAIDLHSTRFQMLLLFGYDIVYDENANIIGIKKI